MSQETDRSLSEKYSDICRRAAEGNPSAVATKIIIEAVMEDKISEEELRMISDISKRKGVTAAYGLFIEFYKQSQPEEAS
ncbi:hypothetical protein [Brevibacillus reuszeri]|uniref:hypothetical protein n=1 Tax=Brevibacillus reuszeri TaxID=54915 RepID=UPI00289BF81B|nr:hypothetical protein [Brevibacillus reuszeri]